ncbi:MAG: hypothetical protein EI684_07245 [Candidatus Viridilinea halotolerans]|uniref:Uncharacterized protein n=1 Tax=Candidatus Viridilinea halotolerans TaxID=2491704 RepID=A0A426U3H5_9CHLR|nr:MAG: hypothetical protein EI684_07245 [Candidatus Viridilinea halotolerans]
MFATTVLITGSIVYAGVRIMRKRKGKRTPVWLAQSDGTTEQSYAQLVEPEEETALAVERDLNTNYALATISLSLDIVAALIYQPLRWVSMPMDIYNLATILDDAYAGFFDARRSVQILSATTTVLIFMFADQIVMVSLVQWCYFTYQKVRFDLRQRLVELANTPEMAWRQAYVRREA